MVYQLPKLHTIGPTIMVSIKQMFTTPNGKMIMPEEIPTGMITLKLTEQVKTDPKFWEKTYNKTSSGTVVFWTLLYEDNDYAISLAISQVKKTLKVQ